MLRFFIFLLVFGTQLMPIEAQSSYGEDLIFYSQAQLDAFASEFPSCTHIKGNLHIEGSDIHTLQPLANVRKISGALEIVKNDFLKDLDGLQGLQRIGMNAEGEAIILKNNAALRSLRGLGGLTTIEGHCDIQANMVLTSLEGLNELQSIHGNLRLYANPKLRDISALQNLSTVSADIFIEENRNLRNLRALSGLETIGGDFCLRYNPKLCDIAGMNATLVIDGAIDIQENTSLKPEDAAQFRANFSKSTKKTPACEQSKACSMQDRTKQKEAKIGFKSIQFRHFRVEVMQITEVASPKQKESLVFVELEKNNTLIEWVRSIFSIFPMHVEAIKVQRN